MNFELVDRYTNDVIDVFGSLEQANKALSRLFNEPGEQRYEIRSPKKPRVKKTDVKKESD